MFDILKRALPQNTKVRDIAEAAEAHIRSPSVQDLIRECGLLDLEAQSIFVYTASQDPFVCPNEPFPYLAYNAALRNQCKVDDWKAYSYLLENALKKLPSTACTVYRGLNIALSESSHLYYKGNYVYERPPTSTTKDKKVTLKKFGAGIGDGPGTFLEIRVKNAKDIVVFSSVTEEQELLIPQNALFRVSQVLSFLEAQDLKGFGDLPPNADLVILEEVCYSMVLGIFLYSCNAAGQVQITI
jgi:hypothetical protein